MTTPFPSMSLASAVTWLKRLSSLAIALGILLLAITGLITFFSSPPSAPHPLLQGYNTKALDYNQSDLNAAANHLSLLLSVPTSSSKEQNLKPFLTVQNYLQSHYPAFHALARRRILAEGSILYFWPGSNSQLAPALWLSHTDVYPASNPKQWLFPPFSGEIADSGIWGRGSVANKTNVVAMLEALDLLARSGFKPQRSLYLAFSHDANSLNTGNKATSTLLKNEGKQFSYILDEGGYITERYLPNIEQKIAFIGIAEKSQLRLQLTAKPSNSTSALDNKSKLTNAVNKIVEYEFDTDDTYVKPLLDAISPQLTFKQRWALSNHWLMSKVVHHHAKKHAKLNEMLTSVMIETLPSTHDNVINMTVSMLPEVDKKEVVEQIGGLIDDETILLSVLPSTAANAGIDTITPTESPPYQLLWQSIKQTHKSNIEETYKQGKKTSANPKQDIIVAPVVQLEPSSSSYYQGLSEHILRFNYLPLSPETQASLTGMDEHISKQDLRNAITFYYFFAKNTLVQYD